MQINTVKGSHNTRKEQQNKNIGSREPGVAKVSSKNKITYRKRNRYRWERKETFLEEKLRAKMRVKV